MMTVDERSAYEAYRGRLTLTARQLQLPKGVRADVAYNHFVDGAYKHKLHVRIRVFRDLVDNLEDAILAAKQVATNECEVVVTDVDEVRKIMGDKWRFETP